MYVIEGLDNVEGVPPGSFAVLTKIHHAAIDGVSGAELTAAIHDLEVEGTPPPQEEWRPEPDPSVLQLSSMYAGSLVRDPLRFARAVRRVAPGVSKLLRGSSTIDVENSGPVPRTRFNGLVSPHRVVDGRSFSLDDIREIRHGAPGATVNDVILALCSGSLRRYLTAHG